MHNINNKTVITNYKNKKQTKQNKNDTFKLLNMQLV